MMQVINAGMTTNQIKDVLTSFLTTAQLDSKIICSPVLPAPWGMSFLPEEKSLFHVIKTGNCIFSMNKNKKDAIQLYQGDVLFIPRAKKYSLSSSLSSKTLNYVEEVKRAKKARKKDTMHTTNLICGKYRLKSNTSLPFFSLMPDFIHIKAQDTCDCPYFRDTVQMLIREDSSELVGSSMITLCLIDMLLIFIVRHWLENNKLESKGWLTAMTDPEISKALSLMHKSPYHKWTVDSLAKEVNISRTKFINKFNLLVGSTPMKYLANWRIDLSTQLLKETNMSTVEVAQLVGYDSEVSFIRAFKKVKNTTPGKFKNL